MNGEAKRTRLDQRRAPIHEALENFRRMRVVPFDVPGHKRGRGNPELTAFLGQQCVGVDVNRQAANFDGLPVAVCSCEFYFAYSVARLSRMTLTLI